MPRFTEHLYLTVSRVLRREGYIVANSSGFPSSSITNLVGILYDDKELKSIKRGLIFRRTYRPSPRFIGVIHLSNNGVLKIDVYGRKHAVHVLKLAAEIEPAVPQLTPINVVLCSEEDQQSSLLW